MHDSWQIDLGVPEGCESMRNSRESISLSSLSFLCWPKLSREEKPENKRKPEAKREATLWFLSSIPSSLPSFLCLVSPIHPECGARFPLARTSSQFTETFSRLRFPIANSLLSLPPVSAFSGLKRRVNCSPSRPTAAKFGRLLFLVLVLVAWIKSEGRRQRPLSVVSRERGED